jgi:protein-S-isoprenylcysteine O-methyltransferase Ste14
MNRLLPTTYAWLLLLAAVPLGLLAPTLGPLARPWRLAGLFLLVGGLGLARSGHSLFARLGTNIETFEDPTLLVTTGPFRYTRNPMYLGLTMILAGVALLVGSLTVWLAPAGFVAAADRRYIPFEEGRMRATFGPRYDEYRACVPRWLGPVRRQLTP